MLRLPAIGIAMALSLVALAAKAAEAPKYVSAKAWHILPETHSDESGYFSLCEGLDGMIYVGTAKYNQNAYLVAFDPREETQRVAIDVHRLCGLKASGYAAQAKIHTRNFVGPSGKVYCGSKQGYRRDGDTSKYPGGYVMVYDPRIGKAENLGMPKSGQGVIDVAADERRGLLYVVTCEDQHWMLYDTAARTYRELGPLLTPYATTLVGADGRASALTGDFELAQYDPADGQIKVRPILLDGRKFTRANSSSIPTWVLSADARKAWLVLMNDPTLIEIDLSGRGATAAAVSRGKLLQGKNPDCRSALCLSPDGWIYAVVRIDNQTGFGSGYLHHLVRYDTKNRKHEDLGVLAVRNPDYFDFVGNDGQRPPWSHGFHALPDGTLTPLHCHMAMIVTRDGTIYVTVIYPFTLLQIDQFRLPRPATGPAFTYLDAVLKHCDRIEADLDEFTGVAELVAARHVGGGVIGFVFNGQTLQPELFGRSGGMVHVGFERPFRQNRTDAEKARDVAIIGWDRPPAAGDERTLRNLKQRGCYLIGFGPQKSSALSLLVPLCDAFFDTGTGGDDRVVTLSGGRRCGRSNHLVNAMAGWVFTAELIGALTRRGKMPTMWKAYAYADGPEWGKRYLGKKQFHDDYRVAAQPAGRLAREYLQQIRYHLHRFQETQLDQVRQAADLIAAEARHGGTIKVASAGHMPGLYVGRHEDSAWAHNIEVHDGLSSQTKAFAAGSEDGALVLRLGYSGLHKDLAGVFDRKRQRVILVTAENPRREFSALPARLAASIDLGYAFGDACVAIEGYPLRVLPPSGVMQAAAYEAINVEVLARRAE